MKFAIALLITVSLFTIVSCDERQKDSKRFDGEEKFEFFAISMPGKMKNDVALISSKAVQYFTEPSDISSYIKDAFDKIYESPWQCSVSKRPIGYASRHNENYYAYYRVYNYYVLLYRTRALNGFLHPMRSYSVQIKPDFSIDAGRVQLIKVDMPGFMKNDAVDIGISAVQTFVKPENIADFIKNDFNKLHKDYWQCHVFKRLNFGSAVTTNNANFIFFRIDEYFIVLYRTMKIF